MTEKIKQPRLYIAEMCKNCLNTCKFELIKGGDILYCPRIDKKPNKSKKKKTNAKEINDENRKM